jgi:uncharacterized damage-inducible protein DinB
MEISKVILAELEAEGASTVRMLERVPADKLDWRPHPRSMSIGELATHIARIPSIVVTMLRAGHFDTAQTRPSGAAEHGVPAVEGYRRNLDEFRSVIGAMDNEQMMQPFRLTRGDKVIMDIPKAAAVRSIMLNHSYHHRGQLSVYLRLLDIPVPAIYGTSADEPGMGSS